MALLFFVYGLVLGSFGNVLIYRVPEGKSIGGRSACPSCRRTLGVLDLIPVLSYVWLRGKCRTCAKRIAVQYPLVELATGLLAVGALWLRPENFLASILLTIACWLLLLIAVIDARTGLIPDALNIPFVLISLLYGLLTPPLGWTSAVVAGGFFALQWIVSRGRWIGTGDIPLGIGIGFLLRTVPLTLVALGTAYSIGAIIAVIFLLRRAKTLESSLAFGPLLVIGTYITLFCGSCILSFLLGT